MPVEDRGNRVMETEAKDEMLSHARETLKEIQSVCDDFSLDSVKKTLQSVMNFTRQNQYLDIAVLGQFKAGKSSFLNGFINENLAYMNEELTTIEVLLSGNKGDSACILKLMENIRNIVH